ncbi:uncharacterized protein LOC119677944 isoform X1 [Teleopsis dalmanni]|uniref:uncharacterized protein LOC119677944 isoform X1 n=1 Tax=Teleopsis dalmanni TaxID=139649 RepID=UPI0018CE4A08|nr:uncharacterized protein LOC119677944 isoform X1 [Teleopsis dalmanni]
MSNMKKDIDCLPCRLVSGFGIIGIGTYLYTQANKRKGFHKNIMVVISAGAVGLGVARLLNMPFLKANK